MKELYQKDGLTIRLVKGKDGKESLQIVTLDNPITVNGLSVFTPNPLRDFIPFYLQSFLKEKEGDSSDLEYLSSKKDSVAFDMSKEGADLTAGFMIKKDSVKVRFDWISHEEDTRDYLEEELSYDEVEEALSRILPIQQNAVNKVRSLGFGWKFSHNSGAQCFAWFDLTFDEEKWDKEKFEQAWDVLDKAFKAINEVLFEYGLK